ncbi:Polyphosphatidylinositol phosphatase INP52 [Escovopsis weberi]|uniref:Polyphosphatidylinositol phosphatase INP52 n=1 Tax=Escovopsis weberi TaxID=150374 RepID=A0A0M9VWX7_ESCWE|nr:Polyphosphatidylinositol phosphatase INP52 [Escovopsis weberi]
MEFLKAVGGTARGDMTPPTLDLLVLTFNCAEKLINVPVFATHLERALQQNATELPELVVFSLQEVAPLSYAFIGDYFLGTYMARFDEAINIAAARLLQDSEGEVVSPGSTQPLRALSTPYTLVKCHNVGYTAMMLFARDPSRLKDLKEAEIGFGAAEMGNKGAVGFRFLYDAENGESTELTFVAAHLAAMEWNLARRNSHWGAIMRGLTFENPEKVVHNLRSDAVPRPDADSPESGQDLENIRLLNNGRHVEDVDLQRQLHDLSVFKPSSHLFVAGDFNYRIATTPPGPDASFPSMDPQSPNYFPTFFRFDQLTRERNAGRTFHGLSEHEVQFPPTYKYMVDSQPPCGKDETDEVQWSFAPHRYPGWTDRILFLELPPWIKGNMNVRAYDALPVMRTSDHRPVFLRVDVPLIAPIDLSPPKDQEALSPGGSIIDPRVRLPVEIDPDAWEKRAAARRKEVMAGWSIFLWSTQQGAYILASLVATGVGGYWLYQFA